MEVTVTNNTPSIYRIASPAENGPFADLDVLVKKTGARAPETEYGTEAHRHRYLHRWSRPGFTLQPGEKFKYLIVLNKEYDLSRPGRHTVQAHRVDAAAGIEVRSNKIEFARVP
jgi:hypothetical protein